MTEPDRGPVGPPLLGEPSPALTATDVVIAQLEGMRREPRDGAGPGAGVRAVWAFASPGNRAATGPVERFAQMLRDELYRGLLEHRVAQLGPLLELGDEAHLEVLVLSAEDRAVGFTWVLGRQAVAPYEGCWMTEAVLRHPDQSDPAAAGQDAP